MIAGVAAATLVNSTLAKIVVNPETRQFVDENGRSIIFHGVNVVYKVDPYIPSEMGFDAELSLNDEDIENLAKWGMNFVRLGVMWEAVERTRGEYDTAYLAKVDELITKLGEKGIYTLVDAHQDVFARTICGEGVPDFYAKEAIGKHPACINRFVDHKLQPAFDKLGICYSMEKFGYRKDENEDPVIEDCQSRNFAYYYTSKESFVAFSALYKNKDGLQDKFVNYWNVTSQALAANPYVVGFDPLNEPFAANPFREPKLAIPGIQDKRELAPMYERIYNEAYHPADSEAIMWFEPNQFPDTVGVQKGYVFPVGFEVPPGGEIGSPYHVLNDHTYCCAAGALVCGDLGEPPASEAAFCKSFHDRKMAKRDLDAQRLGLPLFWSEFGACLTEENCTPELKSVTEAADRYLAGWAYWEFKNYADLTTSAGTGEEGFYNADGSLQTWKVRALARSYLQNTQGVPSEMSFDMDTSVFSAKFVVDTTLTEPSVLYASEEFYYQDGRLVDLQVDGVALNEDQVEVDDTSSEHYRFLIKDHSLHGKTVTVTATNKVLQPTTI